MAQFVGLSGGTHHMKLAIGDAGDCGWDSAVFLKAGSFTDVNPAPEPASLALLGIGLAGLAAMRRRKTA